MNCTDTKTPYRKSLRRRIQSFAQFVNRKTYWLDGLKNRLGITSLVLKFLAPSVKPEQAKRILASLDDHYITSQIEKCKKEKLHPDFWILLIASMGDIVACEPIPRYLKKIASDAKIHWIVSAAFYEILEANPCVDEVVAVQSLSEGKDLLFSKTAGINGAIAIDCHFDGTSCTRTNRIFPNPVNPGINIHTYYSIGSLLECFSSAAGLPRFNDAPVFHFSERASLPTGINPGAIVFHCHSSEACRDWTDEKWNELASRIVGAGGIVVEVGTQRSLATHQGIIDWTGIRSIQQIARIIESAALFVGIDSGFGHIANATRTRSLILLGQFRNFSTYSPYSGEFALSPSFRLLHAPEGKPASILSVDAVFSAVQSILNES